MAESKLSELTMDFAVNTLKLCDSIKAKRDIGLSFFTVQTILMNQHIKR